jgi:hypothetical protein
MCVTGSMTDVETSTRTSAAGALIRRGYRVRKLGIERGTAGEDVLPGNGNALAMTFRHNAQAITREGDDVRLTGDGDQASQWAIERRNHHSSEKTRGE